MPKITEKTILSDLLEKPKVKEILVKYNLPCLSCPMAQYEMNSLELGTICQMYNINTEKLLQDLNKVGEK